MQKKKKKKKTKKPQSYFLLEFYSVLPLSALFSICIALSNKKQLLKHASALCPTFFTCYRLWAIVSLPVNFLVNSVAAFPVISQHAQVTSTSRLNPSGIPHCVIPKQSPLCTSLFELPPGLLQVSSYVGLPSGTWSCNLTNPVSYTNLPLTTT